MNSMSEFGKIYIYTELLYKNTVLKKLVFDTVYIKYEECENFAKVACKIWKIVLE